MRLSSFNLFVDDAPEPGLVLVHNTFSGAYLVLPQETVAALRRLDAGEALSDEERALVDDPDLRDPDVGVLVESREAEEAEFAEWFARKRRRDALSAIVNINLACNFECTYCCQADIMSGKVMSPEVADQSAEWLARRALEAGVPKVEVTFCGGEPLLHPERIEAMATRMRGVLDPAGVSLSFGLITNGYFLDGAMLDRLVPLGLASAQITLDGDETTHHLTRVSKKGEDTFRRIFDHTVAASRRIRVTVNGNYQESTIHGFAPLIRKLEEAGLSKSARMTFTPALASLSAPDSTGSGACTWSDSETSQHLRLYDEILRSGFQAPTPNAVGPCAFHEVHNYAIDPDGNLFKCPGFLGHPEWAVGHVTTGLTERYDQMVSVSAMEEAGCGTCAHRPNCGGSCVADAWMKAGTMQGVNCEKPYFDRVQRDVLSRGFLLATEDSIEDALRAFPEISIASGSDQRGRRSAALQVLAA